MSGLKGTIVNPEAIYGKSAYEIAVMHGFEGTEEEWLASLKSKTDLTYDPTSENAQSGTAVAEAIRGIDIPEVDLSGKMDKFGEVTSNEDNSATVINIETSNFSLKQTDENYIEFDSGSLNISGQIGIYFKSAPTFTKGAYLEMPQSAGGTDIVNKSYVDNLMLTPKVEIQNGIPITCENNTDYKGVKISILDLYYPDTDFICSLFFTTAPETEGNITINFPTGTKFIGAKPTFGNDETWELNIMNGVVVGGKVV